MLCESPTVALRIASFIRLNPTTMDEHRRQQSSSPRPELSREFELFYLPRAWGGTATAVPTVNRGPLVRRVSVAF